MIVSTPLNLPKLVPSSWENWWKIWEQADYLKKENQSPNSMSGLHFGFDVYRAPVFTPVYTAKLINLEELDPGLYNQIVSLPIKIYGARFVQSHGDFPAHIDNFHESWSIRNMFYCEDQNPQWYYSNLNNTSRTYLRMSEETNWWAYLDGAIKHGTRYRKDFPKIILQIFSEKETTREFVEKSFNIFPDQQIIYNKEQDRLI